MDELKRTKNFQEFEAIEHEEEKRILCFYCFHMKPEKEMDFVSELGKMAYRCKECRENQKILGEHYSE